MKKAFRKSLKRQASLGYFSRSLKDTSRSDSYANQNLDEIPILWPALAKKYQFNYPKDWYSIEAHWLEQIEGFQEQPVDCPGKETGMNNSITRISQCNESYQLCNSLPRSFIVPKDLKDTTLMDVMSTVIKDHRVPVISYCCPIEYRRNFIIRCASWALPDQQARVIDTLAKVVKPLEVFHLNSSLPTLSYLESAHKKLRNACQTDEDQSNNFLSKIGKWLSIVSSTLKIVKEITKTLLLKASVLLIEDEDCGWNNIVSSLVQLLLEPHRRTIRGFESLISKEWIYLSGGQVDYSKTNRYFVLFLDCVYQIYVQNASRFEFTSEYLRYLYNNQFANNPSIAPELVQREGQRENISGKRANGVIGKSLTAPFDHDNDVDLITSQFSYKPSSVSMVDLNLSMRNNPHKSPMKDPVERLNDGYSEYMYNPFYEPAKDCPTLQSHDHITNMKFWSSLYLRRQPSVSYGCFEEIFYFQLASKNEIP